MASLRIRRSAPLLLLLGLITVPAAAQTFEPPPLEDAVNAPEDFGSDTQNLLVSYTELVPPQTSGGITTAASITNGSKWISSTSSANGPLSAALNGRIPNGSRITQICVYGRDDDAAADRDVRVSLIRNHATVTGADPGFFLTGPISSSGAPGNFRQCSNVDILVDNRYDIDGDGAIELIDYNVLVELGNTPTSAGIDLAVRFVRIDWHRQVSPAPASATFSDVPTSHPQFQFVEALFAAGITAGCGGGNYCPDAPLTRGQMAVFLSVALGLHWPAF